MMDLDSKFKVMGMRATVLLRLHLKDPKTFDAQSIVEKLFDQFEEFELEEEAEE